MVQKTKNSTNHPRFRARNAQSGQITHKDAQNGQVMRTFWLNISPIWLENPKEETDNQTFVGCITKY